MQPDEVLLVVDSMIGQEAAELTRAFHEQVGITELCSPNWTVILGRALHPQSERAADQVHRYRRKG